MTKNTKTKVSVLALVIFFIVGVASSSSTKNTFSDAGNFLPPAFKPDNGVLLIQFHPDKKEKMNTEMINWLEKNYPYPYELADSSLIKSKEGKYADTKKYRYGILWRYTTPYATYGTATRASVYRSDLYGHFIDRSTGTIFPETKKINNYSGIGYQPFINSIVKRFK